MTRKSWAILLTVVAFLALAITGTILRAPQIVTLARDGFPAAVWPAPGTFARVEGAGDVVDLPPASEPADFALRRFRQNGGRALLVDREGVLIVETYGEGTGRATRLNSYSMVKSLVGALTLRAIADGKIKGLDDLIADYVGAGAPRITVREALTMTSGLVMPDEPPKDGETPLDDAGFSPFGPLARVHAFGIEGVLPELRVDPALRGEYHYQSANTALLGMALERAYGRPLSEVLSDLIWRPAGAASAEWRTYPKSERISAYCCLYASAVDWLKVGRFLLNNGASGSPFLPDALWRELFLPTLAPNIRRQGAYGLHVRHDVLDRAGQPAQGPFAFFAGHDGQTVYLLPEQNAVVVRFGKQQQLLHTTLYELFPEG